MRDLTADELAAIAAAFLVTTAAAETAPPPQPSRWRLAGRLPSLDVTRARFVARAASRWSAAGRLDD